MKSLYVKFSLHPINWFKIFNKNFLPFLVLFFTINLSAKTQQDQTITINSTNTTLLKIITAIEKQTNYLFVYDEQSIDLKRVVTIVARNAKIDEILLKIFEGTDIDYKIEGKNIVLKRHNAKPKQKYDPKGQQISGLILDENKQTIIGAVITVVGTSLGTTSDPNGKFLIYDVKPQSVLRFSYLGYQPQQVIVGDSSFISVQLKPNMLELNDVVVTAQAIGQKNAIKQQINSSTIKNVVAADRLQENPDANAAEAIGRLPGISVQRSGGEGVGLVIRGLDPRYTAITLNGIELPATSGSSRSTNLSGISQYALQGAEVYKSLTADMDANSVAGSINLKLREAPKDFHANFMAQSGYNHLNNYFGNYKFLAELSNRFFNNKFGVLFTATAEKVNRSVQTMGAGYVIESNNPDDDILLNSVSLNINSTFIYRQSAMLSLDYKVSPGTTVMLYSMYNKSQTAAQRQTKNYGITGAGSVGYGFSSTPNAQTDIFQTSLSGESKFNFLNLKADYGISYSKGQNNNLGQRSWNFAFDNASSSAITDIAHRKLDPSEVIPLFTDSPDKLMNCWLTGISVADSKIADENYNAYLNFNIPFKFASIVNGYVKFGAMYRQKSRLRDDTSGSQTLNANVNQFAAKFLADSLNWLVLNPAGNISANGLTDKNVTDFLGGKYNFGNTFNIDKLNQISDTWERISDYYFQQGPSVYLPKFGEVGKIGYTQNVAGCIMNDQNIQQTYGAGYIMSEINIGKYIMFLPGIRYEKTFTAMKGRYALQPVKASPISAAVPGVDTTATNSNQFILPMLHLRIKPTDSYYIHLAYTQTLSRPDFNSISPNYFLNTGYAPFTYQASNPNLNPEQWTNLDAQVVFHAKKIGLLSINAFYKTVKDKIWNRNYQRIKGDPIIDPFPNTALVNVSVWENHAYTGYVNGFEFEWQTSFSYLPKPFCYFTFTANYTYTNSLSSYPYTRIDNVVPPGGGRPVAVRTDSVITGPMLNQPKNIANVSLGYNKDGFNAWLSFQYNGQIFTGINYRGVPRLNSQKDYFYRWDLQLTQKFAIRDLKGFEVLLNIANLSNYAETQRLSGDVRNTYMESYGITADLGLRFRL